MPAADHARWMRDLIKRVDGRDVVVPETAPPAPAIGPPPASRRRRQLDCVHLGRPLEPGPCATKRRACGVFGECTVRPCGHVTHHCRDAAGRVACGRFEEG